MSADKLVNSAQLNADLKNVADAIRDVSMTEGNFQFPEDFVDALESIPNVSVVAM